MWTKTPKITYLQVIQLYYSVSRRHCVMSDQNIKQWLISITLNHCENNSDDWPQWAGRPPTAATWQRMMKGIDLSHSPPSLPPSYSHLFIHEDIDDRVDDRARFGQDRGDDAGLGRDQAWWPKGCQQSHDAVRQPAQQVADHHYHHHEQHPLLTFPAHRCIYPANLETARERGSRRQ